MIAQDTGGAIIGPARADIYYGAGEPAGMISGPLQAARPVRHAVPQERRSVRGGRDEEEEIPLPQPRPANIPQDEMAAAKPEVIAAVTTAMPLPVGKAAR